jgi:PKD repeat protein
LSFDGALLATLRLTVALCWAGMRKYNGKCRKLLLRHRYPNGHFGQKPNCSVVATQYLLIVHLFLYFEGNKSLPLFIFQMTMKQILLALSLCIANQLLAQVDSSNVVSEQMENKIRFKAQLPALKQIPGAPKPFYTYLWDFGDGHFSTQENPEHVYDSLGNFDCVLYAVNNYDDGKKPGKKNSKISVKKVNKTYLAAASPAEQNFFKANGIFELKYNCMAKPGDTMVLMAGIKKEMAAGGKLFLLLNEKKFDKASFDTAGLRLYHQANLLADQQAIAAIQPFSKLLLTSSGSPASNIKEEKAFNALESKTFIQNTMQNYDNVLSIDLKTANTSSQFQFANLAVRPEMMQDTNATITITGLFLPDSGGAYMHQLNIPVVASHDPNKMNLREGRLSYRLLKRKKALNYKIRFQNDGEGPARKILLDIELPKVFDPATVEIKDLSPYCKPCDSVPERTGCWELIRQNDTLAFVFKGIYLPGTNQRGVDDKDSTKGFVEFEVKTKKKLDNLPFKGKTAIYFDKNPPVITNFATGRFKPSLSPLVMAGYEVFVGNGSIGSAITVGVGVSMLAPFKPYFQAELFGKQSNSSISGTLKRIQRIRIDSTFYDSGSMDSVISSKAIRLGLVPLQLRYNLNDWLSLGLGVRIDAELSGTIEEKRVYAIVRNNRPDTYTISKQSNTKAFDKFSWLPFLDLGLGRVRLGPSLGARYYYGGEKESYGYIYAAWRF